jgi:hypothetical protein
MEHPEPSGRNDWQPVANAKAPKMAQIGEKRGADRLGHTRRRELVAGALVAVALRLPERIAAVVTSFGGGLLVAAIAFELVPEADERAGAAVTALGLLAGTLVTSAPIRGSRATTR